MNPVLVTGAQGFLGRFFVAAALRSGEYVVGVGRSPRSDTFFTHHVRMHDRLVRAPLPSNLSQTLGATAYSYYQADVSREAEILEVLRAVRPKAVVHLAAALRDDEPQKLAETNIIGTASLMEALCKMPARPACLILGSSSSVYGNAQTLPISEDAPCAPVDLYGISKHAAERIAALRAELAPRLVFARIFNLVGPGQDERHVCGRFAAQSVNLSKRKRTIHTGDLRPTRDFIDARDAANGILTLLRCPTAAGAYNVCSGTETRIERVLQYTLQQAGAANSIRIKQTYRRDTDPLRNVGDNAKLRALGWVPAIQIEESLRDVIAYYRSVA